MLRGLAIAIALVFGTVASVHGQTTAPAADSPKQALLEQDSAAKAQNLDADRGYYQAENDQLKKLAGVIAEGDLIIAKLESEVGQKYGDDLASAVAEAAGSEDAKSVKAATEKVDGDKATVDFKNHGWAIPMIRLEGKWKISLADLTNGASDEQIEQLTTAIKKLSESLRGINDLVEHDKFRSGEGVRDRVQEIHDQLFPK